MPAASWQSTPSSPGLSRSNSQATQDSSYPPRQQAMYPASALLPAENPSYSTDDFTSTYGPGIDAEDVSLTASPNGYYGSAPEQQQKRSNSRPGLRDQDPNAYLGGGYSRPGLGGRSDSAASEADWKRRAGALSRGATRRVKLTRQGHFIAVSFPVFELGGKSEYYPLLLLSRRKSLGRPLQRRS
jgi:hypothetical protein